MESSTNNSSLRREESIDIPYRMAGFEEVTGFAEDEAEQRRSSRHVAIAETALRLETRERERESLEFSRLPFDRLCCAHTLCSLPSCSSSSSQPPGYTRAPRYSEPVSGESGQGQAAAREEMRQFWGGTPEDPDWRKIARSGVTTETLLLLVVAAHLSHIVGGTAPLSFDPIEY